jgi:hypothetical protein
MEALRHVHVRDEDPSAEARSAVAPRRVIQQASPRMTRTAIALEPAGYDQPREVRWGSEGEVSLVHLLDLRRRYRSEASDMRTDLAVLQAALETSSRQVWHLLTSGQAAPADLRTRCDDLVQAVEAAERDLADVHLAIDAIGHEVSTLLAARAR